MDFSTNLYYCFSNTSLTQRVLHYLTKKLYWGVDCITVIFLNDCWLVCLKLRPNIELVHLKNCQAVLNESGFSYERSPHIQQVTKALDAGCDPMSVMDDYHVAIISHGLPQHEELAHFKEKFVAGLGYCPPSLV